MRAINRLNEAKVTKYDKYISSLIPAINERLNLNFTPMMFSDPYTYKFRSLTNSENEFLPVELELTNNRIDLDGILWGTFKIAGKRCEIGNLFGDLNDDLDIIEDSYYYHFEQAERKNEKIPAIDLN